MTVTSVLDRPTTAPAARPTTAAAPVRLTTAPAARPTVAARPSVTGATRPGGRRPAVRPAPVRCDATRPARSVSTAPGAAAEHQAGVHLTRRGRLTVLLTLVVVLFAAFSLGRGATEAATSVAPVPAVEQATVQPGETLWEVARRIAPDNDPRQVVDQIRRLNDLPSAELQAGQQLLLPVAG